MNKFYLIILLTFFIFSNKAFTQDDYNMDNSPVTACEGYFYDSGGSTDYNVYILFCAWQGTYENDEHYIKTFCSNNGQNLQFAFDFIDIVGSDYLKIYDGNSTAAPLIATLTSANSTGQYVSSGTCLTFEFQSYDNGGGSWGLCHDGGNWKAYFQCIEVYQIDEPEEITTCNGIFTDDGGMSGTYSPNVNYTKTFCPNSWNCVKLYFNDFSLASGDTLLFFSGSSAVGAPIATLTSASPFPSNGISSDDGDCLTIVFKSDGTNQSSGWTTSIFCPPTCGTPPLCSTNPPADNQCITATPICNLDGFCGNTSATYNSIAHNGQDWDNISGLMDDFCGTVENNSWLSFIAEETSATLNVWTMNCSDDLGIQMQIYATTPSPDTSHCLDFTPHSNCVSVGTPTDFVIQAYDLIPGETYYLMIDGYAGDVCDYVISAASGIAFANITPEQTICLGNTANISVDGVDSTASFTWTANPPDPTMQQSGNYILTTPLVTTQYTVNVSGPSSNPLCGNVNETFYTVVNVIDSTNSACQENVTCEVSASSSVNSICEGDPVSLTADGDIYITLMANDFNNGTVGVGWASTVQATFTNPCGPGPDGSTCLWMGAASPAPRNLTSIDFDVQYGGEIKFYLRYSIQGDASPCEGPDEIDEGITLQFSTDYGLSWTPIAYFNPSGAVEPNGNNYQGQSTQVATGTTPFTSWAQYSFPIPVAAQTTHSRFRWIQEVSTDFDYDHWGLDSIFISTPPPGVVIDWTSNPPGLTYTGNTPPDQYPSQTTTYIATVTDGEHWCTDSLQVIVNPNPTAIFTADSVNCFEDGTTITFTGNYSPTTIFVWDFDGGTAVPGTGLGPHDVTWATSGVHTVSLSVTDTGGCTGDSTISLTVPDQLVIDSTGFTNVLCYGESTGTATVTASGGTPPLIYSINGTLQGVGNFSGLSEGDYTVTVTDQKNCQKTSSFHVSQPLAPLTITVSSDDSICAGQSKNIFAAAMGGTAPYSYTWKDASNSIIGTTNTINVSPTSTSTYSVFATDANNCFTSPKYVTIYVSPFMSSSITTHDCICNNSGDGNALVSVSGGIPPYSYTWIGGDTNYVGSLSANTYYVTITDSWNCKTDTNFTINEPTLLVLVTNNPTSTKCYGSLDGVARVTASGGSPGYYYSWSNGGSNSDSLMAGVGFYTVSVYDSHNCMDSATIQITQPSRLVLIKPDNETICIGQSTILSANSFGGTGQVIYHWTWSENGQMQSAQTPNLTVDPIVPTTYFVYAEDANGCFSGNGQPVFVFVHDSISAEIFADKTTICPGDTINVTAEITGGSGEPYYCTLQDGSIVVPPFSLIPEYIPLNGDTIVRYILTAHDFCNSPAGTDTLLIKIHPLPPVNFKSDTLSGCEPLTVNFEELNPNVGQTYLWNFHDDEVNSYSYAQNPKHTFEEDGIYDVSLTVTSTKGCPNTLTVEDMITVFPKPSSRFHVDPKKASIIKPIFQFTNLSSTTFYNTWFFGDGNESNEVDPTHRYDFIGTYTIQLIVETQLGCKDTSEATVIVLDEYTFYAPSAFSPGEDNSNDIFFVLGNGIDPANFHLIIYDRWGEIIYETTQYDSENPSKYGWDGKVKGKAYAEIGTYTWYVTYKDLGGTEHQEAGPVTIVK